MMYGIAFGAIAAAGCVLLVLHTKQMEWENNKMQAYMQSMEELYSAMKDKIEVTRRYRHDLAKHIQMLETMTSKYTESQEVYAYMEYMLGQYKMVEKKPFCSDEIVDAVCEMKTKQCEERRIPLTVNIAAEDYSGIKEIDLVGLLCNLLDNAIEENEKIEREEKRGIELTMQKENHQILISVKNRVVDCEHITFSTRKSHREEHGLGLQIIRKIAEKYQGTPVYTVSKEEEKLSVELALTVE